MENKTILKPEFTNLINLASERLGAKALVCSDDFFAEKENLLKPGRGIFIADKYTDRGKWMDGWESRRKRIAGHDWCIIQLGAPGIIRGLDIDTNHFLGNHPPFASVEVCSFEGDPKTFLPESKDLVWKELLPRAPLNPGSQHFFEVSSAEVWTHLRLNIFPDGGVARLKVYGEVYKNWNSVKTTDLVDLAAAANGAKSVLCNDMFFSHMDNLLMPGRGVNMGDGWETKRNRTPNNRDWVIVKLAHRASLKEALVDTCHFKGNYPDTCSLEGLDVAPGKDTDLSNAGLKWTTILPSTKLAADKEHLFETLFAGDEAFSHIRLNIFPDGGVSRLRLYGHIKPLK